LAVVLAAGAAARLLHLALIDVNLPVESGGLFLEFSGQIAAHGFRLPAMIPYYTPGGIPFAYPPLAFYLQAFLIHTLALPEWPVTHILPPLLAVAALPLFWLLARAVFDDFRTQLVALGIYALMPAAFLQQVQDEGLAEAVGTLALLMLALALLRARRDRRLAGAALSGLAAGLCILAAPGSAVAAALLLVIWGLWTLGDAYRHGHLGPALGSLAVIAAVALLVSAPYWLAVVRVHGIGLFVSAFLGQGAGDEGPVIGFIDRALLLRVSQAPYPVAWDAMILAGLVLQLIRRRWLLPLWLGAMLLIPREWDWLVGVPASLLAATAMVSAGRWLRAESAPGRGARPMRGLVTAALLGYALLNGLLVARQYAALQDATRTRDVIAAASWAGRNLPEEAEFIIPGDSIREWAPHVVRRTVLNVSQGSEWEPVENTAIRALNRRLEACDSFDCLDAALRSGGLISPPVYILLGDVEAWQQYSPGPSFQLRYRAGQAAVLEYQR